MANEQMISNMIAWAKERLGIPDYAGWCLDFIEDALEESNGIEIFGGDSAKMSCEMYRDALRTGIPEQGAFVFYDCLCPSEEGPVNWGHCGISLGDGQIIHAWDVVRVDGYSEIEKLTALTGDHPRYLGWVPLDRVLAQKPDYRKVFEIETERLLITEFTPDMAQVVRDNSQDEDNKRFVPDEVWETVEETENVLAYLISQYGSLDGPLVYPIIVKKTKDNIGYVQLCPIDDGKWEIGYHIAKKYTGKGYASEAVKAFLPVIAELAGLSEIYGICLAENKASFAVMKKCGFETVFAGIGPYQGAPREIIKNVWRKKQ